MATLPSTSVSLPLPSSRRGTPWRGERIQRLLAQDRTLGYLFLFPAILVILGLVAYPFASAIVMTFQEKTAGAIRTAPTILNPIPAAKRPVPVIAIFCLGSICVIPLTLLCAWEHSVRLQG